MKCPRCVDGVTANLEYQGALVAVCSSCKGCWLEPGVLRELLMHVYASAAGQAAAHAAAWASAHEAERRGGRGADRFFHHVQRNRQY